jgi:hypothetical protein
MAEQRVPLATPMLSSSEAVGGVEDRVAYPGIGAVFLGWTVVAILASARYIFHPARNETMGFTASLAWVACFSPWTFLTPLVFRLEGRFPLGAPGWGKNFWRLALVGVPLCFVASLLMWFAASAGWSALGRATRFSPNVWGLLRELPVAAACFWASVAVGYFFRTMHQLRVKERQAARLALEKSHLEAGLNQAQLEVLRAKLNPHFLFNSLQNISVLTGQDPQTASRMLTRLGELLRAVLRRDSTPESTLREEVELTGAYVALEQLRFGDRLRVDFQIAPDVQSALVPCFVLQPLIENAIVHGLRGVKKHGLVVVSAARRDSMLVLTVRDNGTGLKTPPDEVKVGVGLGSTRERLERMYPGRHAFSIGGGDGGGTEVRMAVPLRFDEDDQSPDDE